MNPENLIYFAVAVFTLMIVGLVLTILEFRKGSLDKHKDTKGLPKR